MNRSRYYYGREFEIGDRVVLSKQHRVDYSDCDLDAFEKSSRPDLEYVIPAGAEGEIISPPYSFLGGHRQAVRFFSEPNWPNLYFEDEVIGSGHYVPIPIIELAAEQNEDGMTAGDIMDLYQV